MTKKEALQVEVDLLTRILEYCFHHHGEDIEDILVNIGRQLKSELDSMTEG